MSLIIYVYVCVCVLCDEDCWPLILWKAVKFLTFYDLTFSVNLPFFLWFLSLALFRWLSENIEASGCIILPPFTIFTYHRKNSKLNSMF